MDNNEQSQFGQALTNGAAASKFAAIVERLHDK